MARSKRKSKKYFVYAVYVRTAISSRYSEMAIKSCFDAADAAGFTDCIKRDVKYTNVQNYILSESISKTIEYLKCENKAIILIFDQFEELFSKKELYGLFDSIRNLCNLIDSLKSNIIIGFSWKTDLTIPVDHPAYYMWSNMSDRRKEFEIVQFNQSEIKSAISVFGKQLDEKINPILSSYLAKQCQGYPWLLKKLCIHVHNLIAEGVSQEAVIGKRLNIVDIFERDLSELTAEESSCIMTIAKDTPADFFKIEEIYHNEVIQSLINRRIVIRRASKLILYWDIFRDYVLNKTIPLIVLDYLPQQHCSSIVKCIMYLQDNGNITTKELANQLGYQEATVDNILIDAVMFGIAKRENGLINLTTKTNEGVIKTIQEFFKKHILYIQLCNQYKEGGTYAQFSELFGDIYAHSNINIKTKQVYCSKLYNWFLFSGLIHTKGDRFIIGSDSHNSSDYMLLENFSRRQRSLGTGENNLFWGQTSPEKLIKTVELIKSGVDSNIELRAQGLRNALEILTVCRGIRREGDKVILIKPLDKILHFISISPTIKFSLEQLNQNENLKGKELGYLLNEKFMRKWSDASFSRYGSALIIWTKYIKNLE